MFIFKICVWIKSGNIFLAHPVYAQAMYTQFSVKFDNVGSPTLNFFTILEHINHKNLFLVLLSVYQN